jgi:hypothetical protein
MRTGSWAIAVALFASAASAKTIEGVDYPEELNIGGHAVKLVGVGLREKWWFNIYTMGVYQKTPKKDASHLIRSDEPKFLWIRMLRAITGDQMREALDEGLKKNLSEEKRAAIKSKTEIFKSYFPEKLPKGIDIGFTYLPGQGTLVKIAGESKGTVPGADFMRALWRIWFGRRPADKDLKKAVLEAD